MANTNTGTLTVRVPGYPEPIQFADWTHDKLYHTVQINSGSSLEVQAFIGAIGSQIPGGTRPLTQADTNIPRSGDNGLSEGWEALIYSVQVQIVREWAANTANSAVTLASPSRPAHVGGDDTSYTAGGALFDFLRKTYFRFTVNQKTQSEGPVEKYPQGSGISVFGTSTDLEVANNGVASPRDAAAFVLPIWLRPNIAYVAKLTPAQAYATVTDGWSAYAGTAGSVTGFDVRVSLVGLVKRPVT
jgi:hypothetical protein